MSQGPRILIQADAGPQIGGGHVMRCLTLARALAARGAACAFLAPPDAASVLDRFADGSIGRFADEGAATAWAPDLWLVDSYRLDIEDERRLAGLVGRVAAIDDLARPHDVALVIDPSFGRDARAYAPGRALAGPDYALVRHEFAAVRPRALSRRDATPERGLIALGLTDVGGITGRVIEALGDSGLHLDVAVGGEAPSLATLEQKSGDGLTLHVDTPDMAALMARAEIAVGAGGSSTWERACLGLPAITLILADNQAAQAHALADAGATIALDARAPGWEADLAAAWRELADDADRRASLSQTSADLCDGLGAQRCAEALLGLVG